MYRRKHRAPWSGPSPTGWSLSGCEALAEGLLDRAAAARLASHVVGRRVSVAMIEESLLPAEQHHYRLASGRVELRPMFARQQIAEEADIISEYTDDRR